MSNELTYPAFESRYRNREYIGSGGFAKVYKVFDHAKNHYVALKMADVKPEWDKFTLKNEVELVNKLPRHRNIARYDACYRFNTGSLTGEMDFAILRFYEYGNLEQFLKKEKTSIEDKRLIIQGILDGIAFLHREDVVHRDLKAQNILLHREDGIWTPKITDFGLSREILEKGDITNSAIGLSYSYAAPEQIQNKKILKNVDLWAAGVIIYRVIADELPFKGRDGGDSKSTQSQLVLSRKIINLELPPKLETVAEPYKSMIKRCLVLNPEERVQTAEELIRILWGKDKIEESPLVPPMPPEIEEDKTELFTASPEQQGVISNPTPPVAEPEKPEKPVAPPLTPPIVNYEEKTEVIPQPLVPEAPKSYTPSDFRTPPKPVEEYNLPKANVTQFLNKKETVHVTPEPPPVTNFQPNTGDPKRSKWWLWILIPLLLTGLGFGGYYAYENYTETPAPNPIPPFELFDDIDIEIEAAKDDKIKLLEIDDQLGKLIIAREHLNNYRPLYLKAKTKAYLKKRGAALKILKKAVNRAINNSKYDHAKLLLLDMEKDQESAFKKIVGIEIPSESGRTYWDRYIELLQKMNLSKSQ